MQPLRHVQVSSTPTGTSSSSGPGDTRVGYHLLLPSVAQHRNIQPLCHVKVSSTLTSSSGSGDTRVENHPQHPSAAKWRNIQPLRHVKVFSTPAGTPSSSGSGDTRVGNHLPLPSIAQHWGILVEDDVGDGVNDTFFELYRPNGGIGVLRRNRLVREAEEQHNSAVIKYTNTECVTSWGDDAIEIVAQDVCKMQMKSKYSLLHANCQDMANMLLLRIAETSTKYKPYRSLSYTFGQTPSERQLAITKQSNGGKSPALRGKKTPKAPDWMGLRAHDAKTVIKGPHPRPRNSEWELVHGVSEIHTEEFQRKKREQYMSRSALADQGIEEEEREITNLEALRRDAVGKQWHLLETVPVAATSRHDREPPPDYSPPSGQPELPNMSPKDSPVELSPLSRVMTSCRTQDSEPAETATSGYRLHKFSSLREQESGRKGSLGKAKMHGKGSRTG